MQCDDKKTDMRTFAAEPEDIGTRIDVFAAENSDALSRSGFKKLIEEGNVLVNDKAVKANYKLRKKRYCYAYNTRGRAVGNNSAEYTSGYSL